MRTLSKLAAPAIAAAALALTACGAEQSAGDSALEPQEAVNDGEAATGEEIEEAVPGIEEAAPEGDTPNTAEMQEPGNADYAEIDDPVDQ